MKAITLIKQGCSNKEQIEKFKESAIEDFLSGYFDKLEAYKEMKALAESLDLILKDERVKASVLTEAQKYEGKTFHHSGAEFQICEVGVKYDYSVCQDTEWNKLTSDIEDLTKKRKARETQLQARLNMSSLIVDADTGQVLLPPAKTSQTIVKVKL
ncbi:MAG: hypothetical protein KBG30_10825 [Bacteroidales bacterium]|nr:hypothetical protein [Bacteroidales bacterium]